ncbi:ABC transporter permease [Anaerosacchariphilus polymeriproducens]|uniref:ABC transporter permease n=2 Tax=Anaerosacchariphilus polymeriproducens TaxID=1812858 RepID=A0A371AX18_9FIRM|nr:ABC transporter permease [Anaerosacchariphilus polymeriproducens]
MEYKQRKKISFIKIDRHQVIRIVSLIVFFLGWQFICMINETQELFNPKFLPAPTQVIEVAVKYIMDGTLLVHIGASVYRVLAGFFAGVVVALVLGILITKSKMFDNTISPLLNLIGPIPVYAFLPIFIIWFGIGESSKVGLIAYATFMPLLTYTIDGIRNVNPIWIRSAMSLGASERQVFIKIVLPAALPNMFTGMKVSLALTFSALVVAEMMGADKGLGFMIINARNWFKTGDIFLAIALIGILYSLFLSAIIRIEKIIFKWKKDGLDGAIE